MTTSADECWSRFQRRDRTQEQLEKGLPEDVYDSIRCCFDLFIISATGTRSAHDGHILKSDPTRLIEAYNQYGKEGLRKFRHEASDRRAVRCAGLCVSAIGPDHASPVCRCLFDLDE